MNPLRIALALPDAPLPFGSAAARWYFFLLRELVERGHRVTAFAAASRPEDAIAAADLFPARQYDLRCYPMQSRRGLASKLDSFRQPYSYVYSPELRDALEQELAAGVDVLHLEQLWSGWLGLHHTWQALINLHFAYCIDLENQPSASFAQAALRCRTMQAERRLLRSYRHICTLSERLSALARKTNPNAQVHTVPFGMDAHLYPFRQQEPESPGGPVIGLIGSFNWTPSHLAGTRLLMRLWPEIKRQIPNARLQLVGRCAKSVFGKFADLPDVSLYENVPDILPYFESTSVLVYAPGQGSGMKVKILEAFALGVPVVTNGEGVEGIPAQDRVHAGICSDDEGLVARTVELVRSAELRRKVRRAARKLFEEHCGLGTVDAIEGIHRQIAGRGADLAKAYGSVANHPSMNLPKARNAQ